MWIPTKTGFYLPLVLVHALLVLFLLGMHAIYFLLQIIPTFHSNLLLLFYIIHLISNTFPFVGIIFLIATKRILKPNFLPHNQVKS